MTTHVMIGAVLYANDETILLSDGTVFAGPAWMRLPHFPVGTSLVIEYEVVEGRNILVALPQVRV